MKRFCLLLLQIFVGMVFYSDAQLTAADSIFLAKAVDHISSVYKSGAGSGLGLYVGSEYIASGHNVEGFPFFGSDSVFTGDIRYNGNMYSQVPLQYDLVMGAVVTKQFAQGFNMQLVSEKIDSFYLDGHWFIHFRSADTNETALKAGFYEKLFSDKITVYAKKEKELKLSLNAADQTAKYVQYNKYYIEKGNIFYAVYNEQSLVDVLKDKRESLKKFNRQSKLNFKKDFENSIIQTATYYSQIND